MNSVSRKKNVFHVRCSADGSAHHQQQLQQREGRPQQQVLCLPHGLRHLEPRQGLLPRQRRVFQQRQLRLPFAPRELLHARQRRAEEALELVPQIPEEILKAWVNVKTSKNEGKTLENLSKTN